jgi:[calcium/calmodulin-dependent protein kinase] kinase
MSNIGRGGFGKVKKVFTTQSREIFAMKVANKEKLRKKMLSRTKSAFTFLE